jgi:uncharacterized repeat protein (TIGR01451 family)
MTKLIHAAARLVLGGVFAMVVVPAGAQPPTEDPEVEQAQFVRPVAPLAPGSSLSTTRGLPPLPPTPAVQLMVLVPQDAPPKSDLTYTIKIRNATTGEAHKVVVRMPVPDGTTFVKAEPKPDADNGKAGLPGTATEFYWKYKTLGANASQAVQVTVHPKDDAREVSARAYVSFEHGQQVTTRINAPKLKVKTDAPKQTTVGSPVPVRVVVTNDGRVPEQNVKLTGNISKGCEYDRDAGGDAVKGNPLQRVWEIGTLAPGASKQLTYRVTPKTTEDLIVQSAVDGSHESQVKDDVKVAVKEAKLKIELKGDGTVAAGEAAAYEAVIHNTGTLPLTNVRVTAQVPEGCKVTRMTNGGKESKDQITWLIPRLPPDDQPYALRWQLTSAESSRRTIRASAVAPQGAEHSQQVETVFKGSAALHWETAFDQPTVPIDRSGMLTITVRNTGSEPARNVRLTVTLPQEVSLIKTTPEPKDKTGGTLTFEPKDLPGGKTAVYSVQFRGETTGSAHFQMNLAADVFGAEPLQAAKNLEITRR